MKFQLTFLATTLALAGCGGSDSTDTSTPTYTVSGSIATQHIAASSNVCVDINQNLRCDDNEPNTIANDKGDFSITSTNKSILTLPLLAETNAISSVNAYNANAEKAYLVAPGQQKTTGNKINGISSLLAGYVVNGMTVKEASAQLTSDLAKKGITLSGDLLDNLQDPDLAILDQNVVDLLKRTTSTNKAKVLGLLSSNATSGDVDMLTSVLNHSQSSDFIQTLESITLNGGTLNDTGTLLYFTDENDTHNVESAPSSFPGQDADYGLDTKEKGHGFTFVKLDNSGNTLDDSATEWSCVLDKQSGLMWEIKSNDETSIQYKDRTLALQLGDTKPFVEDLAIATCKTAGDAVCTTKEYVEHINKIGLCGKTDWRLPRFHEVYNIIDFGETETNEDGDVYGLSTAFFPNQTKGSPDIEEGGMWTQTINYNAYSAFAMKGSVYFNTINLLGHSRGSVGNVEIYSELSPSDNYSSFLFPARLVSVQGQ